MGKDYINKIICADSIEAMKKIESNSIALAVTSPPYWNVVDYKVVGQYGQCPYEDYLDEMLKAFTETSRVLQPNGKLVIVTPIIPLSKAVDSTTHTRKLVNLSADIEQKIIKAVNKLQLYRFSLYIWQKQTSKKMFGSYPYPPNIYEDNTIEFINVLVKDGKPKVIPKEIKEKSKMDQKEWLNLSMQVWPIMPTSIQRKNKEGSHPAPFPLEIPKRLMAMYTFKAVPELNFEGDIVLDMFNGSGSTTLAAAEMGRRYIGIDLNPDYCQMAEERLNKLHNNANNNLIIDKIKMPSKVNNTEEKKEPERKKQTIINKNQITMF